MLYLSRKIKKNTIKYHFIIKELVEELKKQFTCVGENTEKYITFTGLIGKEVTIIDKIGEETIKNITYIWQFIDSSRSMASSLSNLVNNLYEGIHEIKCKYSCKSKRNINVNLHKLWRWFDRIQMFML